MSSSLIIKIIQLNIIAATLEKFSIIEKTPVSDNFLGLIYTIVLKFLVTMSTTIWILDLGVTRYIFGNQTRFLDLIDYDNFYCTINKE